MPEFRELRRRVVVSMAEFVSEIELFSTSAAVMEGYRLMSRLRVPAHNRQHSDGFHRDSAAMLGTQTQRK